MHKKHHPDQGKVRKQGAQVAKALMELVEIGVEVISVSFLGPHPEILVMNCPGVDKIRNHCWGQGENEHGKYTRKVAVVKGCTVKWHEERA
ncbi:MAG: hypothetical protein GQ532_18275 [Methylomarinum sp.]|nr:hypothetical protein [Methylomarinum sp.]